MENKIQKEFNASRKYDLKRIKLKDGQYLVQLTQQNVAKVEAMIRHDSDYSNSSNVNNESSSAFWLKKLKSCLYGGVFENYYTILEKCVETIDRENSTHLNADGVGRKELTQRLYNLNRSEFLHYLKNPQINDYKLISILSSPTNPEDMRMKSRRNLSFASKFCHYACMLIFKGEAEQDNFSIYDSIVRKNLLHYAKYYNLKMPLDYKTSYQSYIQLIDKIILASGDEISRNGFDHLLWYFHKAK